MKNFIVEKEIAKQDTMLKYSNNKIAYTILILFFMTVFSYGQTSSSIVGHWLFQVEPSVEKMAADIKGDLATSTDMQNHIASFYEGRQLFFGANGSFSIALSTGQQLGGQWQISGNMLNITDSNGTTTVFGIAGLTNTSLKLLAPPDVSTDNRQLFPELYFSKLQ
jgi:hypothetical protein